MTNTYNDPEIAFAAELSATLARMRADLEEEAIERVLAFVLNRHGIFGALSVRSLPKRLTAPAPPPAPAEEPPAKQPATIEPIARATCPICGWHTITEKGLNLHMFHKHGTTMKEHARMQALNDLEEP